MDGRPAIVAFGDAALLVTFGQRVDPLLNARVHLLSGRVRAARAEGDARFGPPVPGYASLLVPFDPSLTDAAPVAAWLDRALATLPAAVDSPPAPPLAIEVRYGGPDGPDLADVARRSGMSADAVVELHSSVVYRVYMLGFAPGFAYLGQLPAALELPRRDTPRPRVPAGSVAIAARQTAVYPLATPGGWHLIGRTDATLWDPRRDPPALLSAGGAVRFVPS